jgi:hypothetical protein
MFANRMLLLSAALGSVLMACGHDDRADAAGTPVARSATSASLTPTAPPVRATAPKRVAKRAPASGAGRKPTARPAARPAAKPVGKPTVKSGSEMALVLKVPEAHLPPAGQCRIWKEGATPFQQPQARSCEGITPTAPAGSMILYRPSKETKIVRVRYVDAHRAGVVVRVRVFDAVTGKYLRDEKV